MIKYLKIIFIICLSLILNNGLKCQTQKEIKNFSGFFNNHKIKETYSFARNPKNELDIVFSSLYLTYKNFVSSQDLNVCVFYPSCSTYALMAIQQKGIIIGFLAAFDRLTRCNGFSGNFYPIDNETHLYYDPVD